MKYKSVFNPQLSDAESFTHFGIILKDIPKKY